MSSQPTPQTNLEQLSPIVPASLVNVTHSCERCPRSPSTDGVLGETVFRPARNATKKRTSVRPDQVSVAIMWPYTGLGTGNNPCLVRSQQFALAALDRADAIEPASLPIL